MSHFAFVNPGGPQVPDLAKAKRYGITRLYWQANDVQISAGLFAGIRDNPAWHGIEEGIMRDPIWGDLTNVEYDAALKAGTPPPAYDATDLAHALDDDLVRLGVSNAQCAVLADIEYHNTVYMLLFLKTWRELRPKRVTGWTLEPLQGGWITSDLAAMCRTSSVTVYPQTFRGDMSPVDPDLVRSQLIEAGIPRGMVALVYQAAHIPASWDGLAFGFDQLP